MNYKKIIKNRNTRIRIMQAFNWVPDRVMIAIQYFMKTGRKINWKKPARFTEKIQLYKIYSKDNKLMERCVDKADVRSFVEERGLSEILIPLYGIYNSPDRINFDDLPDSFVIKDTLGSGGNSVIICSDKHSIDLDNLKNQCSNWVCSKYKHAGREHVYDNNKHRIIIEKLLNSTNKTNGIIEFKFFCFYGKPEYIYVISNRKLGVSAELGIYDTKFNFLPYFRTDERAPEHKINKPNNFEKMLHIAEILSKGFPEVRVDLFNVDEKVYFSELTFFDGSGYMTFDPDEFDYILGKSFDIQFDMKV